MVVEYLRILEKMALIRTILIHINPVDTGSPDCLPNFDKALHKTVADCCLVKI